MTCNVNIAQCTCILLQGSGWCRLSTTSLDTGLIWDMGVEVCPHQLEIAKYPAILTIPTQIIQLICVLTSPKLQLAGYLVKISIPRYLELVCEISRYLSGASSPARRHALSNAEQNISSLSFEVRSRADEDAICNFRIISQIRNSGLFGNLELMRTDLLGRIGKLMTPCWICLGQPGHGYDDDVAVRTEDARWIRKKTHENCN